MYGIDNDTDVADTDTEGADVAAAAVALGTLISRCTKLRDEQFIAAAEAVARLVTDEDRANGATLPPLHKIREVSACVARAVAQKAYEGGFATDLPKPHSLMDKAWAMMYNPQYRRYR
jgi:malate dehydrogenase (oxaloacetate-decarboxylating)(NADP+)